MTEEERFKKEVDETLKNVDPNDINEQNEIKVCDTPKILKDCGMDDLPMLYRKGHLRDALKEKDRVKHHHGLDIKQIYNLPKNLSEPAMILRNKDENKSNCPIIILNDFDEDKVPLFVAIEMNTIGTYELKNINTNDILSIYGKDNFDKYLNEVLLKDGLIFYDKEKVHNLDAYCGLQLSTPCIKYEPNKILQQITKKVNTNAEKSQNISDPEKHKTSLDSVEITDKEKSQVSDFMKIKESLPKKDLHEEAKDVRAKIEESIKSKENPAIDSKTNENVKSKDNSKDNN